MTTKRMFGRAGLAAAGVLALGVLTACGSGGSSGGGTNSSGDGGDKSTLAELKNKGVITVGVADERPYSWVGDNGKGKGATIAIDREIFGNLGIDKVKVVKVAWNSLIPGLNAGRFDAVSAGMSILPDRCANAAFADPEIMYTTTLMVKEGNPKGLSDMKSVKNTDGVKLAVLNGGIEAGYAKKMGIPVAMSVKDSQAGMDAVKSGRADAFAMTAISLNYMAKNNPNAGVETTGAFTAKIDGVEQIGAGSEVFRKSDKKLLEAYNTELDKVVGSADTYLGLVGEYGFTKENLPPEDLTTEQLCEGDLS